MSDQRFPRKLRLRSQAEFDHVFERGVHAADEVLVMRTCANGLDYARLGLTVSRKVGNAVLRNHWKRLIREAFRLSRTSLPAGYDFVVRPRRGAQPEFHAVKKSMRRLARRAVQRLEREQA